MCRRIAASSPMRYRTKPSPMSQLMVSRMRRPQHRRALCFGCSFFFNDTPTTEIYTLSLHDALPISVTGLLQLVAPIALALGLGDIALGAGVARSEEHTSELQSLTNIVCRLLLEKKKTKKLHSYIKKKKKNKKKKNRK